MISNTSLPGQQQQQQQQQQGTAATGQRVINRNYLQIQSNNYNMANKSNTLNTKSFNNQSLNGIQDPKRSKSISRSLRSLFSRSSSNRGTITSVQKRDKSYDVSPYSSNFDAYSGKHNQRKKKFKFKFNDTF